jgi:hypothetical protein
MAKNPADVAKKWSQGLAASGSAITAGVQAVTVAPGQAAVAQKAQYVAGVQANVDKWARRTAAVPLGDWQSAMINKGVPRIATGATAAEPKFEAFMGKLLPHIDQVKRTLPARGNLDQNIARMTTFVRGMTTFKNS